MRGLLTIAAWVVLSGVSLGSSSSPGPCRYSLVEETGRVRMENDFVLLELDPRSGGRGTRLYYKSAAGELTRLGPDWGKDFPDGGLFGDRLVGGGNEFLTASYSMDLVRNTGDEITVCLHHKGGNWVQFEKSVTIRNDRSSLAIQRAMRYGPPDSSAPKQPLGLWSHQSLCAGLSQGKPGLSNTLFVPTVDGILAAPFVPGTTFHPGELGPRGTVTNGTHGWIGVVGESGEKEVFGAVYEEDAAQLDSMAFYINPTFAEIPTAEFFHAVSNMAAGDCFKIAATLAPARGLKTITGAGSGLVGGLEWEAREGKTNSASGIRVALCSDRTRAVTVSVSSERLPDKGVTPLSEKPCRLLIDTPVYDQVPFEPDRPGTYVIRATIRGNDGTRLMEMEKPLVIPPASGVYARQPVPRTPPQQAAVPYVRRPMAGPESPHEKWFKPLAGEPPHALLFLSLRQNLRLLIELTERMSLSYDYVFNMNPREPLMTKNTRQYSLAFAGLDRPDKDEEDLLAAYLARDDLDCMVLPWGFSFKTLSEALRRKVTERIRGGVGLVLFPFRKEELEALLAPGETLEALPAAEQEDLLPARAWDLTGAMPYTNRVEGPFYTLLEYEGQPLAVGARLGRGRVIGLMAETSRPMLRMATQNWRSDEFRLLETYQEFPAGEYNDYLVCRMILWASRKEPPVRIASAVPVPASVVRCGSFAIELAAASRASLEQAVSLEWKVQDPFDRTLETHQEPAWAIGPAGRRAAAIAPSTRVAGGRYIARLFLKDADGRVLDACAVPFSVEAPVRVTGVSVEPRRCAIGAKVTGAVHLAADGAGERLRLVQEWVEPSGRIVGRSEGAIAPVQGEGTVAFSMAVPETRALILDLRTRLMQDNEQLAERIDYLVVDNPPDRSEARFEGYALYVQVLGQYGLRRLADAGVEFGGRLLDNECDLVDFNPYLECLKSGLRFGGGRGRLLSTPCWSRDLPSLRKGTPNTWPPPVENDPHNVWRSGYVGLCYEDPRYQERVVEDIKEYGLADTWRLYGPEFLNRGDEARLQGDGRMRGNDYDKQDEVCYCGHHLKKFREWLHNEYGSLERLNAEWEATYTNWADVLPLPARLAKDLDNRARFVDFRLFLCQRFARLLLGADNLFAEAGLPGLKGYGGPIHWESPFACHLAYYVSGAPARGRIMPYIYPRHFEPGRSYPVEPALTSMIVGYDASPGHTYLDEKYYCWKSLLYGIPRFTFYGNVVWLKKSSVLTPTFERGSLGEWIGDLNREMKETGIAKLLLTAAPETCRVGVVESYRSLFAAFVEPERFDGDGYYLQSDERIWRSASGWRTYGKLLDDLGVSWRIVNEEEVAEQAIPEAVRALILPAMTCVSPAFWQALESFLDRGGCVIADGRLGERDGHGKRRPHATELARLFGIRRNASGVEPGKHRLTLAGAPDDNPAALVGISRERGVALAGGQAKGRYPDETPAVIVKEHARAGCAVYLNFTPLPSSNTSALFSGILGNAGVKPKAVLSQARGETPSGVFRRQYQRGENTYFAMLSAGPKESLRLQFPDKAYQYDVGGRGFLGYSDAAEVDLKPAVGAVLARLPHKVSGLRLEVPPRVQRGGALRWKAVLETETGPAGDHVFRVSVQAPDGEKSRDWSGNQVAVKGELHVRWAMAHNERLGTWTLRLRDSVSGMESQASFVVTE